MGDNAVVEKTSRSFFVFPFTILIILRT